MPRIARVVVAGGVHHVLNRGNDRRTIFHKPHDYMAFVSVLGEAVVRYQMRVLAYCLMPNHWHLVLWPRTDSEIPAFMRWLSSAHVRRHHRHHGTDGTGHLYQGRYKAFIVQSDRHLMTVLRYVEANALRAGLVQRAEDWPWSSLSRQFSPDGVRLLADGPLPRTPNWLDFVNRAFRDRQLNDVRTCARRGRPYGSAQWQREAAARHGLSSTMRPRGRQPTGVGKPDEAKGDCPL